MDLEITRRQAIVAGSVVSIGGVALGGVAVSNGTGGDEDATETTTETYTADEISVTADVGSVSITGEDRSTIELDVTKSGTESALDRTVVQGNEDGESVEVTADYDRTLPDRLGLVSNPRPDVEIDLTVPIELAGVALETVNGSVEASGIETDLTAATTNGSITVEAVSNIDALSSTNGDIDAEIEALNDGAVLETTNGEMAVDTDAVEGDATIESTSGAVDSVLGSSVDATVTASTTNGDITLAADRADPVTNTNTELEATLGDGTHRIDFETTNGDITIAD